MKKGKTMNNFDNLHEKYIESLVPDNDDLKLNGTFEITVECSKGEARCWLDLDITVTDDSVIEIELKKSDIQMNDESDIETMDLLVANKLLKNLCKIELLNRILDSL